MPELAGDEVVGEAIPVGVMVCHLRRDRKERVRAVSDLQCFVSAQI